MMQNTMSNIPTHDNLDPHSLNKLITGVNKIADTLRPTYGPFGGNIMIEEPAYPGHRIANDGKIISNAILLADPVEQMGANLLREICDQQEKKAGDGRKTASIITAELLNQGQEHLKEVSPLQLKNEIDETLPLVLDSLSKQTKKVKDIKKVAKAASESEELGNVIAQAYEEVGSGGVLEHESSGIPETFYSVVDGYRIDSGWLGNYWHTEEDKCVIKNPVVIISKDKIVNASQLEPLYKKISEASKNEIVLFCEEIEPTAASTLALTTIKGGVKTMIIKAPTIWKDWYYEDIAALTGAKVINSNAGVTFKTINFDELGTCKKFIVTPTESRLIGGQDISEHIKKVKERGKKDDQQLLRAARLSTKIGIVKVGANSETELSWKIKKAKDGINASYFALQEGVVPGAGIALVKAAESIPDNTLGQRIVKKALGGPAKQLAANAIMELPEEVDDPAVVVKSAVTNALSIAGTVLTTHGAIVIPEVLKDLNAEMIKRMQP